MSPTLFLLLAIGLTLAAYAAQWIICLRRTRPLRHLARAHGMHFCPSDRFHFAPMIAQRLPIAGAADVRIFDLIYGSHNDLHRYVFSVEYTRGVVRTKSRHRCVAAFVEPRRAVHSRFVDLCMADDPTRPIVDQYKSLCQYVLSLPAGHVAAS